MAYRLTNFSNAGDEQELATGARAINQFNMAIKRAESDLSAGRFTEAFKHAEVAQARLSSAKKMIVSKKITRLYPAASDADLVMRGLWSQFQAQETGRSNFGDASSMLDSAEEKLTSLIDKGEAYVDEAMNVIDKAGNSIGKLTKAKDDVTKLFKSDPVPTPPPNTPPGTPIGLATCVPASFLAAFQTQPWLLDVFSAMGLQACDPGEMPVAVFYPYGASVSEIRSKVQAGRAAARAAAASKMATSGRIPSRPQDRIDLSDRSGPSVNRNPTLVPEAPPSSGIGSTVAVVVGIALLKRFLSK